MGEDTKILQFFSLHWNGSMVYNKKMREKIYSYLSKVQKSRLMA